MQIASWHKSNPFVFQAFATSMISAASQLEAEWKWYCSAIHNLSARIIIINNQVLNKIKIEARILSRKECKYDENMMIIWGN